MPRRRLRNQAECGRSALIYSTYLGGGLGDIGNGIALDPAGNVYVTGVTTSYNFPTARPLQPKCGGECEFEPDAFVTKLNATGSALVYSTYLGGFRSDLGQGIAVDPAGNAYVTGSTSSTNFPTAHPLQAACALYNGDCLGDAFVTKLNAAGSALIYSTYLGGSGGDIGYGIAVDSDGNAYVTGHTHSPDDFPTARPLQPTCGEGICSADCADAFVTKLTAAGSALDYSTYLGGSGGDGGNDIAVDLAGNAYVAGQTWSTDFPTANPLQPTFSGGSTNAFVAKLTAAGSALDYSTYLGGSSYDSGSGIAVDTAGNAYVTGATESPDFPTARPLQTACALDGLGFCSDAFVTKLTAAGSALLYSTYLGGSHEDLGNGIAVDTVGDAYVTGRTESPDLPTVSPLQPAYGGFSDAFMAKIAETSHLSVAVRGLGTVTSRPGGIQCPRHCVEDYIKGTLVALTATPAVGWRLVGWSTCRGTGACVVNLRAHRRVTAIFTPGTLGTLGTSGTLGTPGAILNSW